MMMTTMTARKKNSHPFSSMRCDLRVVEKPFDPAVANFSGPNPKSRKTRMTTTTMRNWSMMMNPYEWHLAEAANP